MTATVPTVSAASAFMPAAWADAIWAGCTPECTTVEWNRCHTPECWAEFDRITEAWLRAQEEPVQGPLPATEAELAERDAAAEAAATDPVGYVVLREQDGEFDPRPVFTTVVGEDYPTAAEARQYAEAYAAERTYLQVQQDGPLTFRAYALTPLS